MALTFKTIEEGQAALVKAERAVEILEHRDIFDTDGQTRLDNARSEVHGIHFRMRQLREAAEHTRRLAEDPVTPGQVGPLPPAETRETLVFRALNVLLGRFVRDGGDAEALLRDVSSVNEKLARR